MPDLSTLSTLRWRPPGHGLLPALTEQGVQSFQKFEASSGVSFCFIPVHHGLLRKRPVSGTGAVRDSRRADAGGAQEVRFGHEAALREGVHDAKVGAACAGEREAAVRIVGDGKRGDLGVVVGRTVEPARINAQAARDAASKGAFEAIAVGPVLGREGVWRYGVVGRGCGLGSHAPIVGRGASTAQRARVTYST